MINVLVHIVDDDKDFTFEVERYFKLNGITEYRVYHDPEEFLRSVGEKRICVIDYRFKDSGMNGLEIAEELKEKYPRTRIIIVTGMAEQEELIKIINLRSFSLLSKMSNTFMADLIRYVKSAIKSVIEEMEFEKLLGPEKIFNPDAEGNH